MNEHIFLHLASNLIAVQARKSLLLIIFNLRPLPIGEQKSPTDLHDNDML